MLHENGVRDVSKGLGLLPKPFQLSDSFEKFGAPAFIPEVGGGSAIIESGIQFPGRGSVLADLIGEHLGFFDVLHIKCRAKHAHRGRVQSLQRCVPYQGGVCVVAPFPCIAAELENF